MEIRTVGVKYWSSVLVVFLLSEHQWFYALRRLKEARKWVQRSRTWEEKNYYMGRKALLPKSRYSAHWPEVWRNGTSLRNLIARNGLYQTPTKEGKKRKAWILLPTYCDLMSTKGFRNKKCCGLSGPRRLLGHPLLMIKVFQEYLLQFFFNPHSIYLILLHRPSTPPFLG